MKLYRDMPSVDVLAAFAFRKYPDCRKLILYLPAGELRELVNPEKSDGIPYTFSSDHLWALMKIDQTHYEQSLPESAAREYVG